MEHIEQIKTRKKSIQDTMQITKAMKLISASKLKKAKAQLLQTAPFFDKVKSVMTDILIHSGEVENIFFDIRNKKVGNKKLYLIISGDKGLAGGYNGNIIKLAEREISKYPDALLLVAGQSGRNYFSRKDYNIDIKFNYPVQNPTVYRAREISEIILQLFEDHIVDEVFIIYTKMASSLSLQPEIMKLLPLDFEFLREDLHISQDGNIPVDEKFLYEPSPEYVFNTLVPRYVKGIIYSVLVEAFTSEQTARMMAMDNATANAEDMIAKLNLFYNRARQAAITQEISEIVGGASVLNS